MVEFLKMFYQNLYIKNKTKIINTYAINKGSNVKHNHFLAKKQNKTRYKLTSCPFGIFFLKFVCFQWIFTPFCTGKKTH